MRNRLMILAAVVGLGCLGLAPAAQATSDNVNILRTKVLGGADAVWGDTCADLVVPPAGDCDETYLIFYTHGEGKPLKDSPWFAYVETGRLTFDGINPVPVAITTIRTGFVELSDGEFEVDTPHLGSASLTVAIPMDDGTTYNFEGTWLATGERQHYGNDGPMNQDLGLPLHYSDACVTSNNHAHQNFRMAEMTGTLNGHPVHSYTSFWSAGTFSGHYLYLNVAHGGCAR